MLSTRYHIASIMGIFFALGVGILIGGTLGQRWMHEAENHVVDKLMRKYEAQLAINQDLEKRLGSLQMMYKASTPLLHQRKVWWIRPDEHKNEMLGFVFRAAGAEWVEKNSDMSAAFANAGEIDDPEIQSLPDIILLSNSEAKQHWIDEMQFRQSVAKSSFPVVIDLDSRFTELNKPEQLVDFVLYLKRLMEGEEASAATHFDRDSRME